MKNLTKMSLSAVALSAAILLSGCSGALGGDAGTFVDDAQSTTVPQEVLDAINKEDNAANEEVAAEPKKDSKTEGVSIESSTSSVGLLPPEKKKPSETPEPDIDVVDPAEPVSDDPQPWLKHSTQTTRGNIVRQSVDFEDGAHANCVIYEPLFNTTQGVQMQCDWGY